MCLNLSYEKAVRAMAAREKESKELAKQSSERLAACEEELRYACEEQLDGGVMGHSILLFYFRTILAIVIAVVIAIVVIAIVVIVMLER